MSAGLIEHLKRKTNEDDNVKILLSQWEFDQKLVGKALENIASYYPHFSSHNESHSHQILVNIERLLGDNIHLLSATDTWLLLESAYWHDIGMLFNSQEAFEIVNDKEFKEYIENLANDNAQDLHDFAKVWHLQGWQNALIMYDNPILGTERYRQLIAEWYRRKHPAQSQKVISDPFLSLGINSPRTELLPKRIYRYLGQICLAHGTSFEQAMNDLPYRQTGMGTENCHPRFIACLLRLGDLFDIDDNRFCPVMMKQVVSIPTLSTAHHHKHLAIREFQLDNQTVSITAECQDEQSYIQTQNWFDWLKEEMQNQMSQWKNIVPHRKFGLLPTIQKLDVKMTSSKILLNNKPMKFSLDEKNAIELLQGSNLYDGESNIYRELIQNAIDATYLRIWIEHGIKENSIKITDDLHPFHEKFQEILKQYPINIDFKKLEDDLDSDVSIWQLSITDKGTGISLQDLQYMQKIAGSSRNIQKKRLMQDMPIWMRPSGAFGIGLHSAFLLLKDGKPENNKIIIETTSIADNASYKIEMTSPLSGNQGYCFIEKISQDEHMKREYGTKLTLNLSLDRRGKRFNEFGLSFNFHQGFNRIISEVQKGYDVIKKPLFDHLCALDTFSKIESVIHSSPAFFKFNNKNYEYKNLKSELYWVKEFNLYARLLNQNIQSLLDIGTLRDYTFFKGQEVEDSFFCVLDMEFDFYGFNAKESLNLNRNKWNKDFLRAIYRDNYFEGVLLTFLNNYSKEIKEKYSDEVFYIFLSIINEENQSRYRTYWSGIKFFNETITQFSDDLKDKNYFDELLKLDKLELIEDQSYHPNNSGSIQPEDEHKIVIKNRNYNIFLGLFKDEWCKNGGIIIEDSDGNNIKTYHFSKKKNGNNIITQVIKYGINNYDTRIIISSNQLDKLGMAQFKSLACASEAHLNLAGANSKNLSEPFLILPYFLFWVDNKLCISQEHNYDFLVEETYKSIKQSGHNVTKESTKQQYDELVKFIDTKMSVLPLWKEALERGKYNQPKNEQEVQELLNEI